MKSLNLPAPSAALRLHRSRLAVALWLGATALGAHAQSATIYGSVSNFDVVNNTGIEACGFEMDIEGLPYDAAKPVYTYGATRYGPGRSAAYNNGVASGTRVTWKGASCDATHTVAHAPGTPFAGTCYTFGDVGCEHFGVGALFSATNKITARWLVRDAANPAAYVPRDPPMAVAMPYYYVAPPAVAGAAPVIVDVVEAPEPPEAPDRYGDAQWMKVFVRQMPRTVTLDELLTTNPLVVPMEAAQLEFDWKLVQADPPSGGGGRQRGRSQGGSTLDPTTRAVVRRYEMYAYTGTYDPVTHEALCADVLCKVPGATERGDFISAQMAAVNVQGDFVSVARAGSGGGNVDSADKRIACGNKCVAPYTAGTAVTLTAKANSGSVFAGWTGACAGTASTCSVIVNGANNVGATFNAQTAGGGGGGGGGSGGGGGGGTTTTSYALAVSLGNPGTVTSAPAGINCGSVCSAPYAANSVVTLTATPLAGLAFSGWSGACSGVTGPVCNVTMSKALSVKANFTK